MTERTNTGPAFQSRIGSVRVAVWSRDTDKGRFHNVRIVRQYQKNGEWHETPTFNGLSDLVHVEEAIGTVKAWLLAEQAEQNRTTKAHTEGGGHEGKAETTHA